jgi:hypothetical protein
VVQPNDTAGMGRREHEPAEFGERVSDNQNGCRSLWRYLRRSTRFGQWTSCTIS